MALETIITFAIASALILSAPGPIILYAVYSALEKGRAVAWAIMPGVMAGDVLAMSLSLAGVGAVIAASPLLFLVLRLAGAAYLTWIGVSALRAPPPEDVSSANESTDRGATGATPRRMMATSFTLTVFHPGGFVFYVAFVPQFLDDGAPLIPQLVTLTAVFLAISFVTLLAWIVFADKARRRLESLSRTGRLKKISGVVMILVGLAGAIAAVT